MTPNNFEIELKNEVSLCVISRVGCTIISWKVNNVEQLFISKAAILDGTKPIRGGIPIVFPQFGTGSLINDPKRQHGFARDMIWNIESIGENHVIMYLKSTIETMNLYPYEFELECHIRLLENGSLNQKILVKSLKNDLTFTFLLHSYFKINDIRKCLIKGLNQCKYFDKISECTKTEENEYVSISQEVDRQYYDVPNVTRVGLVEIQTKGFPDIVLWNPWIEKSKTLSSFMCEEYCQMVCLEVGKVHEPVFLEAGYIWSAEQTLSVHANK